MYETEVPKMKITYLKLWSSCVNFNGCYRGCKKASSLKLVTHVPK